MKSTPIRKAAAPIATLCVVAALIAAAAASERPPRPEPATLSSTPTPSPGYLHFPSPTASPAAFPPAPSATHATLPASTHPTPQRPDYEWHEFYFTRAAYSSGGYGWGRGGRSWAIDYPKSDRQFMTVLKRLTNLDAFDWENAVTLDNPALRRFPFLYALEVGYMSLGNEEIEGLRDYLKAGGFLVIDDFWGSREWAQFEYQMGLVFPNHPIIDLELDHPVFNTFYEIDEILQVPAYGRYWGGRTSERDGYVPYVKGIEDHDGRLMVIINWNTDLGDAWEWAEQPDYPLQYSTFAFQMGVNMIIYAMSH
ncbi:MAG: DUF4159 domain-containing protein [Gemmatimonadota bacterium]|nr:DUF4159 domain-containing protein [Gemmatimonadota bacterium]